MKRHRLIPTLLLSILVMVLVGVVFHAPLTVWLSTMAPEYELVIKSWKELLIAGGWVLLLYEIIRTKQVSRLAKNWGVRLGVAYCVLHIILLPVLWQGAIPALAGLLIDVRFVAFFLLVYCAVTLYPAWRKPLITGSIIAAAASFLFATAQVTIFPHDALKHIGYSKETTIAPYLTVDQNYDYVRINGTLRGPNPLGAYAGIVMALATALLVSGVSRNRYGRWRVIATAGILLISAVGLWFSFSRSALVAGIAAVGLVVFLVTIRKYPRITLGTLGGLLVSAGLILAATLHTSFVQNVIFHVNPDDPGYTSSNEEHFSSLETGWERMVAQPLGAGIGSTGSASLYGESPIIIENQYLFIAHETGWLGFVLFLVLFGYVMIQLWRHRYDYVSLGLFASGVGLAAIGLLLPVWVDDTIGVVWWGLAATALAAPRLVVKNKSERLRHG